jgi:hypothetical protein
MGQIGVRTHDRDIRHEGGDRMRSVLVLAVAAAAAVATAGPAYAAGRTAGVAAVPAVQTVVLTIRPAYGSLVQTAETGSAKSMPDERVDDSNFAVRPGVVVRVVVWNYTNRLHSFASRELGVNVAILPGSLAHPHEAVFTFVAHTYGRISWYCAVPCGDHMGGSVYAIIR